MPTPGERRALIFVAAIAALGVTVRGLQELRRPSARAGAESDSALDRQIESVDSAVAATRPTRGGRSGGAKARAPSKRAAPQKRAARADTAAEVRAPAAAGGAGAKRRSTAPASTAGGDPAFERDPRAAYRARRAAADSAAARFRARDDIEPRRVRRRSVRTADPYGEGNSSTRRRPSTPLDLDTAPERDIAAIPWIGPGLALRIVLDRARNGPFGSLTGLERVGGVTPSLARRIEPYVTFSRQPRLGSAVESWPKAPKVSHSPE